MKTLPSMAIGENQEKLDSLLRKTLSNLTNCGN